MGAVRYSRVSRIRSRLARLLTNVAPGAAGKAGRGEGEVWRGRRQNAIAALRKRLVELPEDDDRESRETDPESGPDREWKRPRPPQKRLRHPVRAVTRGLRSVARAASSCPSSAWGHACFRIASPRHSLAGALPGQQSERERPEGRAHKKLKKLTGGRSSAEVITMPAVPYDVFISGTDLHKSQLGTTQMGALTGDTSNA